MFADEKRPDVPARRRLLTRKKVMGIVSGCSPKFAVQPLVLTKKLHPQSNALLVHELQPGSATCTASTKAPALPIL